MTNEELAAEAARYNCVPKRAADGSPIPPTAEHDKKYDRNLLASCPPQRRWVCRKCGTVGTDTVQIAEDTGR